MKKTIAAVLSAAAILILTVGASFATSKTNRRPNGDRCKNGSCCRTHRVK